MTWLQIINQLTGSTGWSTSSMLHCSRIFSCTTYMSDLWSFMLGAKSILQTKQLTHNCCNICNSDIMVFCALVKITFGSSCSLHISRYALLYVVPHTHINIFYNYSLFMKYRSLNVWFFFTQKY